MDEAQEQSTNLKCAKCAKPVSLDDTFLEVCADCVAQYVKRVVEIRKAANARGFKVGI